MKSVWHLDTLRRVLKHATHVDFSAYRAACSWYREVDNRRTLEGAAMGAKVTALPSES